MAEEIPQNFKSLILRNEGRVPPGTAAKPAALLLTPAPIISLRNDLDKITDMGPHFCAIALGVRMELEDDWHANQLRATLMRFNTAMEPASERIESCFFNGERFYNYNGSVVPDRFAPITREAVERLLDPSFQASVVEIALMIISEVAEAAKIVREQVLPQLPQLKQDLERYVADYLARDALKGKRRKSWVPSLLQDAIGGTIAPTPWNAAEVRALPERLATASALLHRLPSFLDNLELHFRRLSALDSQQMLEHGYSTFDDLIRLARDRRECSIIFDHMQLSWSAPDRAFGVGALQGFPGEKPPRDSKGRHVRPVT